MSGHTSGLSASAPKSRTAVRYRSDFSFSLTYSHPPPPPDQTPRPSHPRELDFGPFRVHFGLFRVRLGPFQVRLGSVLGGVGVGGVRERGFCKGKNITTLSIFKADSGIARNNFVCGENHRSLAKFDCKEIAHLGALIIAQSC